MTYLESWCVSFGYCTATLYKCLLNECMNNLMSLCYNIKILELNIFSYVILIGMFVLYETFSDDKKSGFIFLFFFNMITLFWLFLFVSCFVCF